MQGQFWLKSDMETLGQFGPIEVLPRDQITGTFSLNRIRNLDKDDKHCKADPAYSYTECLMDYAKEKSDCSVDVFANDFNCTSDGLYALIKTLEKIRTLTKKEIVKMTGCYPKCEIYKYNFHLKQETDVKWKKEWLSSFYLSAETTTYQMSMENYSYDAQVRIAKFRKHFPLISPHSGSDRVHWRLPRPVPRLVCDVYCDCCPSLVLATVSSLLQKEQ